MIKLKEKEIEEIRKEVEEESPDDPSLQQVHIARKILVKEAKLEKLRFLEYIRLLGNRVKNVQYKTP